VQRKKKIRSFFCRSARSRADVGDQKAGFLKTQFTAQTAHYKAEDPAATHDVICVDGIAAGRRSMDRSGTELHILDITVLVQSRNEGVGTVLLRRIIDAARNSEKPVTIYVESFNLLSVFLAAWF
jgi:ribosomal protein S18 acetylase RimI-like enzyme